MKTTVGQTDTKCKNIANKQSSQQKSLVLEGIKDKMERAVAASNPGGCINYKDKSSLSRVVKVRS